MLLHILGCVTSDVPPVLLTQVHMAFRTLFTGDTSPEEVKTIQAGMEDPKSSLKLLYVTPEKVAKSKRFMSKLEKMHKAGRLARSAPQSTT